MKHLLNYVPGWGWLLMGIVFVLGTTLLFIQYAREPRERRAMVYSILNFLGALALGVLVIVYGVLRMRGVL